jgi:hypothetical protein
MKVYYAMKVHTPTFCAFIEEATITGSTCSSGSGEIVVLNSNPYVREKK